MEEHVSFVNYSYYCPDLTKIEDGAKSATQIFRNCAKFDGV